MKTKFKFIKILVATIVLSLCCSNLYSQKVISSVNAIDKTTKISKKITATEKLQTISSLSEENWLSNKNYLEMNPAIQKLKRKLILDELVTEESRNVEDWMLDNDKWHLKYNALLTEDRDTEDWMFDSKFWTTINLGQDKNIEGWMTDAKFWKLSE